jgi:WD40 repeat protein
MEIQARKKFTMIAHAGSVYALAEGNADGCIFSGSSDKFVAAWNTKSGDQEKFAAQFPAPVYSLRYLPERSILLAGTGAGSLHVLGLAEKAELKILQLHRSQVFDCAVALKHNLLFTAGGDGQLSVAAYDTFTFLRSAQLCAEKIRAIVVSPDEEKLAVASGDGFIRIFRLPDMELEAAFHGHGLSANCLAWHPNGKWLLSGGRDAYLKAWDVSEHYSLVNSIPAHNYAIYRIVFSPDGTLFATASRDKTVKLWEASDLNFLLRLNKENFDGHVNSVNALLWNENGLVSTGDDRAVVVWEIEHPVKPR